MKKLVGSLVVVVKMRRLDVWIWTSDPLSGYSVVSAYDMLSTLEKGVKGRST